MCYWLIPAPIVQWENKTAPASVLKIETKIADTYERAVNFKLQGFLLDHLDS